MLKHLRGFLGFIKNRHLESFQEIIIEKARESMQQPMTREVSIRNGQGLHLRLACLVAEEAQKFSCSIQLANEQQTADAKSILDLILLAAGPGTSLTVEASGRDACQALERLGRLLEGHHPAAVTAQADQPRVS